MKKFIITIIIAVGFFTSLNAQTTEPEYNQSPETSSDVFFEYSIFNRRSSSTDLMPMLPYSYTGSDDISAINGQPAPLGSGILVMAGLAFAYSRRKNRSQR